MLNLDKGRVDELLLQLEERQLIDPRYKFAKENGQMKLLGVGGFSYVYEMYDSLVPEHRYAAKIIGLGAKSVEEKIILETAQMQCFLGEQSEYITRVIALWSMKLQLDEDGNILAATEAKQKDYEKAEGIAISIVLMEKLEGILEKDKYGNIQLLREELATEKGVLRLAQHIGKALFVVHSNRCLHRDIKLENIFWDAKTNTYKLGDFGISKFVGDERAETVVFTDGYGAPEIERQLEESYDLTADIYSFGITLFLLLNGLRFPASDGYRVNIVQYAKDFIMPAPENASETMAGIIRKMCSYYARDRYQSVEEILMDMGRVDGCYEQKEFVEEDFETLTYRESQRGKKEEKEEKGWTREKKKEREQWIDEDYRNAGIWTMLLTAVLTLLLCHAFSPDATYLKRWEFWLLPAAALVEAIFQRVKEFHFECGLVALGIAGFSMYYLGVDLPHIVAVVVICMGIPALTAGVSLGLGVWIVQMACKKLMWLNIFSRWDLGWLLLILLVVVIENHVLLRGIYKKAKPAETLLLTWIMDKMGYLLLLVGVGLFLLEQSKLMVLPDSIKQLHLVRTGIGVCIVNIGCLWYYGLLDNGDTKDESLDQ